MKRTIAIQNLISEQPWLKQELQETTNFTFKSRTKLNIPPPTQANRKLKPKKPKASLPSSLHAEGNTFMSKKAFQNSSVTFSQSPKQAPVIAASDENEGQISSVIGQTPQLWHRSKTGGNRYKQYESEKQDSDPKQELQQTQSSGWRRQVVLKNYASSQIQCSQNSRVQISQEFKNNESHFNNLKKSVKRIEWHSRQEQKMQGQLFNLTDSYQVLKQQQREKKELQSKLMIIRHSIQQSETSMLMQPRMLTINNLEDTNQDQDLYVDSKEKHFGEGQHGKPPLPIQTTYFRPNFNQERGGETFQFRQNTQFPRSTKNAKVPLFRNEVDCGEVQMSNNNQSQALIFRNGRNSGYETVQGVNEAEGFANAKSKQFRRGDLVQEIQTQTDSVNVQSQVVSPKSTKYLRSQNQSLAVMRYSLSNKNLSIVAKRQANNYVVSKRQAGGFPSKLRPRTCKYPSNFSRNHEKSQVSDQIQQMENQPSTTNTNTMAMKLVSPSHLYEQSPISHPQHIEQPIPELAAFQSVKNLGDFENQPEFVNSTYDGLLRPFSGRTKDRITVPNTRRGETMHLLLSQTSGEIENLKARCSKFTLSQVAINKNSNFHRHIKLPSESKPTILPYSIRQPKSAMPRTRGKQSHTPCLSPKRLASNQKKKKQEARGQNADESDQDLRLNLNTYEFEGPDFLNAEIKSPDMQASPIIEAQNEEVDTFAKRNSQNTLFNIASTSSGMTILKDRRRSDYFTSLTRLTQGNLSSHHRKVASFSQYDKEVEAKRRQAQLKFKRTNLQMLKDSQKLMQVTAQGLESLELPPQQRVRTTGIGLKIEQSNDRFILFQKYNLLKFVGTQINQNRYICLKQGRDSLAPKGDIRLEALEHTGTLASLAEYKRIIDSIKKENLEKVFLNFDLPDDKNGYFEGNMVEFQDFVNMHQRFTTSNPALYLGSNSFFQFSWDKGIKPFIYEGTKSGSTHSIHFITTLNQSNAYVQEARTASPVSGEYDTEANIYQAHKILAIGLNRFEYSVAFLNNIAVLKAIMGQLIESLLILKKIFRFLPTSPAIKHNLIFVSLLGEWYFDTCANFELDLKSVSPEIKQMMKFCRRSLNAQINESKRKIDERRKRKIPRSMSHDVNESNTFDLPHSFDSPFQLSSRNSFKVINPSSWTVQPGLKGHANDRCRVVQYNRQLKEEIKACNVQSEAIQREIEQEIIESQNIVFEGQQLKMPRTFYVPGKINYHPFQFNEIRWDTFKMGKAKKRVLSESKAATGAGDRLVFNHPDTLALYDKEQNFRAFQEIVRAHNQETAVHASKITLTEPSNSTILVRDEDNLVSILNKFDDKGNPRSDVSLSLDQAYIDIIRLHRGHIVADKDKVKEDQNVLIDGISQLHEMINVGEFVKLYDEMLKNRTKHEVAEGTTRTLEFKGPRKLSRTEEIINQLEMNSRSRVAKCLITDLMQEKSMKEKRLLVKVLEFIAENANNLRNSIKTNKHGTVESIKELGKLVSRILDGIMLQYKQQQKLMEDQQISNYEKEIAIEKIERQIEIDSHYAKRLRQVQHRLSVMQELERHFNQLHDTFLAAQIEDQKNNEYLGRLGISVFEHDRRNAIEKFFKEDENLKNSSQQHINVSCDGNSEDSDLYDKDLEFKIAVDTMAKNERLGQRPPLGQANESLFENLEKFNEIMMIVASVTVTFEKDLSQFFLEERKNLQPEFIRWRQARKGFSRIVNE